MAGMPALSYVIFWKPYGVLADADPAMPTVRPTFRDYVPVPGVQPAGRLDLDSEGLLMLTDDGTLAHRLAHPAYKLPKTYLVQVERVPDNAALAVLRTGVMFRGTRLTAASVELLPAEPVLPARAVPVQVGRGMVTAWLHIVLTEGKKRQLRHMTAAVGHPALRVVRVALGPLTLEGLAPGEWRELTAAEVRALHAPHL
jgi:23S rRNA pseudouridine2457 synthase